MHRNQSDYRVRVSSQELYRMSCLQGEILISIYRVDCSAGSGVKFVSGGTNMRWINVLFIIAMLIPAVLFAEFPVNTYSIVARDPATGEMGVAVQSHYFSVGPTVAWAEPGTGVVATQSLVEVSYGPLGLSLMREGKSAPETLKALLAADPKPEGRQVAMLDRNGKVDAYTGKNAIAAAGHHIGENYSVQANLMARDSVWPAMAKAFETTKGNLADRMLAALEAAEAEGGDIRGKQSVAIVVVSGKKTGNFWTDYVMDLRVEDHPEPLKELRRLMNMHYAIRRSSRIDDLLKDKKFSEAEKEYEIVRQLAPNYIELDFWHALGLYQAGQEQRALEIFREVFKREPVWLEVVDRLPPSGLIPAEAVAKIKTAK